MSASALRRQLGQVRGELEVEEGDARAWGRRPGSTTRGPPVHQGCWPPRSSAWPSWKKPAVGPIGLRVTDPLPELRALVLRHAAPGAVASVAFAVGYERASQFSREYARQFGIPPGRDAARLRAS